MNAPPLQTRVLGSFPAVLGAWGSTILMIGATLSSGDAWPGLLVSFALVAIVMKADERVQAYKNWQREWGAMAPRKPAKPRGATLGAIVIAVGLLALMYSSADTRAGILVLSVSAAAIVGVGWAIRRAIIGRRRAAANRIDPVAVCIGTPIYAVPSRGQFAALLPDYCRGLIGPSQQ